MKSKILLSCCMFFLSICILKAQDLQWKHFGNLLKARHYNNALYLGNNEILVSGGYINSKGTFIVNWSDAHLTGPPTRSCEIISLKDKTTRLTDSMSFARAEFPMLMTKDSNVVAISGINKEGATGELTPTVELYDRTTKRWEVIGNLIVPRRQHAAVFINDEEIIITGGRNQDVSAISAAEIFNVTTGKSRLIAKFPAAYSGMIAQIASDGSILAGAGREGGLNSTRTGEIYKYDLVNNSWKLSSKLPNAVFGPLVLKLSNNHILLAGGGEGEEPPRVSRQILLEDNSKFLPIFNAQLLSDRVCNGFIQWDSTRVLSVGGVTELGPGLNFTRTCEWINFKTGEVTYAPQLNVERLTFATVSIPQFDSEGKYIDSKVYAIGGFGIDSRNITSIEVLEKSSKPANVFEVETVDGTCNKHQFVITKGSEDVITTKLDTALSNNVSLRTLESTSERIVIECSLQDESVFGYYSVYISNSLGASVRLHDTITSNSVIALLKTSGSPEPNDIIPVSISISPKSTPYSSSAKTGFDSLILFLHYSPSEIDFFKNISSPLGFKNWDWNFINNFSNGAITLSGKGNPVFDSAQIDLSAMVFLSKDYKSGKEIPVFLDSAYCYSSNISCFTTFANNESGLFKSICFETGRKVKFGGDYSIHGLPNPANEKFTLEYQVAFDGNSKIRLVNSFGVETYIRDGFLKEGSYSEIINTTALSSGLYYIIIESGAYSSKIPLMVLH